MASSSTDLGAVVDVFNVTRSEVDNELVVEWKANLDESFYDIRVQVKIVAFGENDASVVVGDTSTLIKYSDGVSARCISGRLGIPMEAEKNYKTILNIFNKQSEQGPEIQTNCQERTVLRQGNRWRKIQGFLFTGADKLIVQAVGQQLFRRTVFAERPISKKDFYYEVKIHQCLQRICVGLSPKPLPVTSFVGRFAGTYAYDSWGGLWGHAVAGSSTKDFPMRKRRQFGAVNDVVGCGVDKNRQIIYTVNGIRLDTKNLFITSAEDLFPCVTLFSSDDRVEGIFGPEFTYDFVDDI